MRGNWPGWVPACLLTSLVGRLVYSLHPPLFNISSRWKEKARLRICSPREPCTRSSSLFTSAVFLLCFAKKSRRFQRWVRACLLRPGYTHISSLLSSSPFSYVRREKRKHHVSTCWTPWLPTLQIHNTSAFISFSPLSQDLAKKSASKILIRIL